ncbi:unnamed protein product [Didymodactylos carnosus]|uniref:Uncharacterized protein n=1 Tax=Didymodactylos carnosus TaxID=1234261 RepID=A0A813P119_9BILA|nr:unnamed protein product [Didymodactylos carnosus]CAF3520302.1 unnamed protein product [Didymodactylos carnosus]
MGSQHLRQQFLLEKSSSNDNKNNCDEDKKKNKHSRSSQKKILKLYLEQVENINSSLCKKDNNEFLCSKQVHVNKLYECIILKLKLIKDNKHATIEQKQLDDIETNIKQLRNDIQTFKKLSNETNLKLLSISLCQFDDDCRQTNSSDRCPYDFKECENSESIFVFGSKCDEEFCRLVGAGCEEMIEYNGIDGYPKKACYKQKRGGFYQFMVGPSPYYCECYYGQAILRLCYGSMVFVPDSNPINATCINPWLLN